MDLDSFDIAILGKLQVDNRLTSEEIAAAVNLSPTAVQRRIKRLRSNGVITADVSVIAPAAVGRRLTAIVQVALSRGGADAIDAFRRLVRNVPEVQQCFYVTGEHDFVLIVTAEDMADYDRLTQRIFSGPNIRKFQTIVAIDVVKSGLQVPLP